MKKTTMNFTRVLFAFLAITVFSCKQSELEEFRIVENVPRMVYAGNVSGQIHKSNERIIVPVSIGLSAGATKAFQVKLEVNADTILKLIENSSLTDTEAIPGSSFTLPNVVDVPYGADSATFEISIDVTTIERLYGKKIGLAIDLIEPSKGNFTDEKGGTILLVLNAADLIKAEEIRYLSFTNGGGGHLEAQRRQNYTVNSSGITIPLGISLSGSPGNFFTVQTKVNTDTITELIRTGELPQNTVALKSEEYFLDGLITVGANRSAIELDLEVPHMIINNNLDKVLAIMVNLAEPSRHLLHPERSSVLVLIYPERIAEIDVTNDNVHFSVSRDHRDGPDNKEGAKFVIDNNINTKFLQHDFIGDLWMQLEYEEPIYTGTYTLTSANDAAARDPRAWEFQASNDGENWTTLDTRRDEVFASRFLTKRYEFNQTVPYKFYRILITDNSGDALFQLAEWRLIRVPR